MTESPSKRISTIYGYLLVFAGVVCFATIEVAVKRINNSVSIPVWMFVAIRFLPSGILLFLMGLIFSSKKETLEPLGRKEFMYTVLLGILAVPLAIGLFQYALSFPEFRASSAAAIFSINPLFVGILGPLLLHEHNSVRNWIGLGIGFVGAVCLSLNTEEYSNVIISRGGVLMIFSALFFALYTVMSKPYSIRYGGLKFTGIVFINGGIVAAFLSVIQEHAVYSELFSVDIIMALLWLILIGTVIGYYCYLKGLTLIPVTRGAYFFFAKPFIALLLSVYILHERMFDVLEWIGLGLICIGSIFVFWKSKQ